MQKKHRKNCECTSENIIRFTFVKLFILGVIDIGSEVSKNVTNETRKKISRFPQFRFND
jgi:hypothetical protein